METRANYFLVSSFVVAIIALAAVGAIWLLNLQPLPEGRAYYEISFKGSVAGLKIDAPVSLSGIPVGNVRKIENDREDPSRVRVVIEVLKNAVIKADSVASIDVNFMFGDASISVTPGSNSAPRLAILPGHTYPLIASQPSPLQSMTEWLAEFMQRTIVTSDLILAMLDDANRKAIADRLQTVEGTSARAVGQTRNLGETIDSIGSVVHDAHAQVAKLNGSFPQLTQGLDTAKAGLDDLDGVVKSVGEQARKFDDALPEIREQQLAPFRSMLRDLEGTIYSGRDVVRRLARYIDDLGRDPNGLFGKQSGGYKPK